MCTCTIRVRTGSAGSAGSDHNVSLRRHTGTGSLTKLAAGGVDEKLINPLHTVLHDPRMYVQCFTQVDEPMQKL